MRDWWYIRSKRLRGRMTVGNNHREWWTEGSSGRALLYLHVRWVNGPGISFIGLGPVGEYDIFWSTDGVAVAKHQLGQDERLLYPDSIPSCDMRADR